MHLWQNSKCSVIMYQYHPNVKLRIDSDCTANLKIFMY